MIEILHTKCGPIAHTVVTIVGDGACLFRSIAFLILGTQEEHMAIREQIVQHIIANWDNYQYYTADSNGDNYSNSSAYCRDMLRSSCYGTYCEISVAAEIFQYCFEIYKDGYLLQDPFGSVENPVKRLRFSGPLSNGHFDAYIPTTESSELFQTQNSFYFHKVITMPHDSESLFRAIGYHLTHKTCMATKIRERLVGHIYDNFERYRKITHKCSLESYDSANSYFEKMSKLHSYGGYYELVAASEVYGYRFEVFRDELLYLSFGDPKQSIKRLKLLGDLSQGHFDVLALPTDDRLTLSPPPARTESPKIQPLPPSPLTNLAPVAEAPMAGEPLKPKRGVKRRGRVSDRTRKAQLKKASKKYEETKRVSNITAKHEKDHPYNNLKAVRVYQLKHPDVNRDAVRRYTQRVPEVNRKAVAKYAQKNPEVNKEAVRKYSQNHPEPHRDAVSRYSQNHPQVNRDAVSRYTQTHPEVNLNAVDRYTQKNPEVHIASATRYQETHIKEKRSAAKTYAKRKRTLPWENKRLLGLSYNPNTAYEADDSIAIGSMSHKCSHCFALKWKAEVPSMCCNLGRVQLPPYDNLPEPLLSLLTDNHPEHKHFLERIRKYNSCFQMTSFGAGEICNRKTWLPTYKVCGQVYHMMGSLIPAANKQVRYLQVYFVGEDQRELDIRCSNYPNVKKGLVGVLQRMMHEVNSYIKELKTVISTVNTNDEFSVIIHSDRVPADSHRGRFNAPTTNEVALVMVGQQHDKRDIVIQSKNNSLSRISELHRSYDALQYPLMFCYGEDGYKINLKLRDATFKTPLTKNVSAAMFYAYRIMTRENDFNRLIHFRALFSQFLVDMYAKIETERLNFLRYNQKKLRVEHYSSLKDSFLHDDTDADKIGTRVILPSTFTGSPRYLHERTQDAMTYVRYHGTPDLFITFTCNPQWREISEALLSGQKWYDRHDIVARVFHLKVKMLMDILDKGCLFGEINCFLFTVEWQKRGLPHVHLLIWLKNRILSDQINSIISAEIPDPKIDPKLHEIVKANMIHGPCGALNPKCICMKNSNCSKHYPKDLSSETFVANNGYPTYRRRSPKIGGQVVRIKDHDLDNGWVVPYSPVLLRMFNAHINVEYCCDIRAIKYILKYINKGTDQAIITLEINRDEINFFETGRYLSTNEAVWRIFGFNIHERYPTVQHLAVHLENGQRVYFNKDNIPVVMENPPKTTLLGFFELCKKDNFAKTLLYDEVPQFYRWDQGKFIRRKFGKPVQGVPGIVKSSALGRIYTVHPNDTHAYHLRMLLNFVRGPTSFDFLKTVDGVVHSTFQGACNALGLLDDGQHWVTALEEAQIYVLPHKMRELFSIMLVFCSLPDPLSLWEKFKYGLADDLIRHQKKEAETIPQIIMEDILNQCLIIIEDMSLRIGGKTLPNYNLPATKRTVNNLHNREYLRETSYDTAALATTVSENEILLTTDQRKIYNAILSSIESKKGKIFFLDAPGGTGKTFLLNLLLAKVRSCHKIALAAASSGIAATLLAGGKTAHSAFKLPFNLISIEDPTCAVKKQSDFANVLRACHLIVWDESTMMHKKGFEALDRCLKDIRDCSEVMGGLTVLLAGDFRQTLPVIPRGRRADEVNACIKKSVLWPSIEKIALRENMRVKLGGDASAGQFADLLLTIGDGNFPNKDGLIKIPETLGTIVKTIDELICRIYPDMKNINQKSIEWFCERAILCPKNVRVDGINDILMKSFEGEETQYRSVDTLTKQHQAVQYSVEVLNNINLPGFPPHKLLLKVGAPIMLLRNLNPPKLCNGTRLQVKALKRQLIEAIVLTGSAQGESVVIPRIPLLPSDYPIEFKRLQFPVKVCFAMTINKSQGQSLKLAGIDLREDCFAHGQFYVGSSRISSPTTLILLAPDGKTMNVVYKEVL